MLPKPKLANWPLTISRHAYSQALLEATLLTAVSVDPHNGAVLHFQTLLILDVLLDAPPEKTLQDPHGRTHQADVLSRESSSSKARVGGACSTLQPSQAWTP